MSSKPSNEFIWWALFGAGGFVVALLAPVHILIQGILDPLGWVPPDVLSYSSISSLVANPIVKLYLVVFIGGAFFHGAHRVRFTIIDLGIKQFGLVLAVLLYGAAVVGTLAAIWTIVRIPAPVVVG